MGTLKNKLYFLDLKNSLALEPCKLLTENDGYAYFQKVKNKGIEGILSIPVDQVPKYDHNLRLIEPTPQLLACLSDHGTEDQRRVAIAVPDKESIFTGELGHDDEGYYVLYQYGEEDVRLPLNRFGKDFSAVPLGHSIYPWTYSFFDPINYSRNVEHPYLVNARTKGLRCFENHPDIQFVLKLGFSDILSILRHAACKIHNGLELHPGDICNFTYKDRQFKVMEAEASEDDPTIVYRLLMADKNGLFPGDSDEVEPEYQAQSLPIDEIMGS